MIQRRQERDLRFLLPFITNLTEEQFRIMLFVQSVVLRESKSALPPLLDSDICEAASTVAATLETAGKGIIYEHQATSIPAQRLVGEIRDALSKIGDLAGSARARAERDAAVALRQIERAAAAAGKELADEEPPVYLRLVGRILQALPNTTGRSAPGGDDTPRLVIPGQ